MYSIFCETQVFSNKDSTWVTRFEEKMRTKLLHPNRPYDGVFQLVLYLESSKDHAMAIYLIYLIFVILNIKSDPLR